MMRVLLLSQFYDPVAGGVERVVQDTARALARRGHEVAVATLTAKRGPGDGDIPVHGLRNVAQRIPGLYADPERPHAPPAPDPAVTRALRRLVVRERPDIVHAHDWLVHSYVPLRLLGAPPVVLSVHDYGLVCATKRLFRDGAPCSQRSATACLRCAGAQYGAVRGTCIAAAVRFGGAAVVRTVDRFLPVSEAVARGVGLTAGRHAPFEVIPNFVPADFGAAAGSVAHARLPPEFLLFVGDATVDKGIDVLLDAHAALTGAPPLVVIGRPFAHSLRAPRSDVRILGAQPHATVLDAIRRSLVTVIPSLTPETFGMVALEAMALGRPIVASRAGALPELLRDGETALLVRPGDTRALQGALSFLLERPDTRDELAAGARADARRFSEAVVVERLERVYRAAASEVR